MTELTVLRGNTCDTLFLPGLPPAGITWRQYTVLGYLHEMAVQRGDAIINDPSRRPGGWNLTAPPQSFEKLKNIANAILLGDNEPYSAYQGAESPQAALVGKAL